MELWHERSTRQWISDYSFAVRTYGVTIEQSGIARAQNANARIVADARRRHFG